MSTINLNDSKLKQQIATPLNASHYGEKLKVNWT